ncbi:PAS domain-containing protein [Agaribacter flavus]|uniref:PAS domain-containing protein n=1 Tax=Agaribacter flavus TaxID=1902781 RepID=A0ABV7FQ14_9ALTE
MIIEESVGITNVLFKTMSSDKLSGPFVYVIANRSTEQLNTLLNTAGIVVALVFTVFIALFLFGVVSKKQLKKTIAKQTEFRDALPSGVLSLNAEGKITAVNSYSAKLLGRQPEKLIGISFEQCFTEEDHSKLAQALEASDAKIHACARSSKLILAINIGELRTTSDGMFRSVVMIDQNNLQRAFTQSKADHKHLQALIAGTELGVVKGDLAKQALHLNDTAAQMLSSPDSQPFDCKQSIDLQTFATHIHKNDIEKWKRLIDTFSNKGLAEASLRIRALNCPEFVRVEDKNISAPMHYIPLHIRMHTQTQKTEGKYVCFDAIVEKETVLAEYKQQHAMFEQQIHAMLNASASPVYALDGKGNIVAHNNAFSSLMRIVNPNINTNNLFEAQVFPENILDLHKRSAGVSSFAQQAECKVIAHDGREMHLRCFIAAYKSDVYLSEESERRVVGMISDITELTELKAQVKSEREQLENMLNLAPVAIATIDAEDRVITANHNMLDRLQYSENELKHGNFYQLFADPAEAGQAAKKLNRTGKLRDFHAKLKGKDNQLHPSELHVDLINREKQEYLCWIADRSDEQFQQDKFDSLLEHSSMPMAILSEQGFSKLNEAALAFFGAQDEYELRNVMPYSTKLNSNELKASRLKRAIEQVKQSGKVYASDWEYQLGDYELPCHATYVPIYKDKSFDSILCIWMDKRELQKADEARMHALNLKQAAERETEEKQKLLANSQDELADKMKSLAETQQQLQSVQAQFDETCNEYSELKEKHESVAENLQQLQSEYSQSRDMLADAQRTNSELQTQLASSNEQVKGLHAQREQIAVALQESEDKYKDAQTALALSEENAEQLKAHLNVQKDKMSNLVSQIKQMKDAVTDKDQQINQVSEKIQSLQSQLSSSTSTTESLRQQLINQRKASEEAEKQRRELEQTYELAQSEINNKAQHVEHLQREMQKLEEMSNQEKGDMQAQQSALREELAQKQQQLQSTKDALDEARHAAEQEKQARDQQEASLKQLQQELTETENHMRAKQEEAAKRENERKAAQQKLWEELKAKQRKLQETEEILSQAKQQTEAEKAEKEHHRQRLELLKQELTEIESRSAEEQAKISESDRQWQAAQEELQSEVEAKRKQLAETKSQLDDIQRQADKERLARLQHEQKLELLTVELNDVETRAEKQQQMIAGNEEQWHKHHAEIEAQKRQLQQALQQANSQNEELQSKLAGKLDALKHAEQQVNQSQSGEQSLLDELEKAKETAEELEAKITQQAEKEAYLQQQLHEQQEALENKESAISTLESKQAALANELAKVQEEYTKSKESLSHQHDSHSTLSTQMSELEKALEKSQQQIAEKESALQAAQAELQTSQDKLAEQESALLTAHKQELQAASNEESSASRRRPNIEKLSMPNNPTDWFDLLPYLQKQGQIESLPLALSGLIDGLERHLLSTEEAIVANDVSGIFKGTRELIRIAHEVNSEVLTDMMSSIEDDCKSGMVDNVSIRWPAAKQSLEKTLRVVYSHLHA